MQSRCISNIPKVAVSIAVSLVLAFMPFTVNLNNYRITLERNEARANPAVFAGAYAFVEEAATAAGFASAGDFIATGVGINAVGSGMTLGTAAGIKYGESLTSNLEALVDSADYPAWGTLTQSEQESWGSEANYCAAKYNSFLAAFGFGEDYERYQNTWGSFTPGEFQFSSSAQDTLEQIGEIGTRWANGLPNAFDDLKNFFTPDYVNTLKAYLGVDSFNTFNGENVEGYPSDLPKHVYVNKGNYLQIQYSTATKYFLYSTSPDTYWIVAMDGLVYSFVAFSKQPFMYGSGMTNKNPSAPSANNNAGQATYNGNVYYTTGGSGAGSNDGSFVACNMKYNIAGQYTYRQYTSTAKYILFSDQLENVGELQPNIAEYPGTSEIPDSQDIYYPTEGIGNETTWINLVTQPSQPEQPESEDLATVISLLRHMDNDLHDIKELGGGDFSNLENLLEGIQDDIQNLDFLNSADLQPLINILQHIDSDMHKFSFVNGDVLKVHDGAAYTELENIYNVLVSIAQKMKNWGDISDAPDLIGDFDFDELENKVPDLLETISDLAPFGSILLLSSMYSIMANYTKIESPELVFPFDFGGFDDQNHELIIDLSWLDDIKPLINFFCIAMLVIAIANATIRIVEIEAAS